MRTIILLAIVLAALIYLLRLLSVKMSPCPKCAKRRLEVIESTKYWVKYKCRHCGHIFVEETGH